MAAVTLSPVPVLLATGGLFSTEAQRRLVEFGPNEIRREQTATPLTLLARQFAFMLPTLAPELEYRIVHYDPLLWDVTADLIIDVLPLRCRTNTVMSCIVVGRCRTTSVRPRSRPTTCSRAGSSASASPFTAAGDMKTREFSAPR